VQNSSIVDAESSLPPGLAVLDALASSGSEPSPEHRRSAPAAPLPRRYARFELPGVVASNPFVTSLSPDDDLASAIDGPCRSVGRCKAIRPLQLRQPQQCAAAPAGGSTVDTTWGSSTQPPGWLARPTVRPRHPPRTDGVDLCRMTSETNNAVPSDQDYRRRQERSTAPAPTDEEHSAASHRLHAGSGFSPQAGQSQTNIEYQYWSVGEKH
jgi:hypothetical protein